jgi:hypothetical protein
MESKLLIRSGATACIPKRPNAVMGNSLTSCSIYRAAARGLSRLPGPSRRGHDAWVPLMHVSGIEFCYEVHGPGASLVLLAGPGRRVRDGHAGRPAGGSGISPGQRPDHPASRRSRMP